MAEHAPDGIFAAYAQDLEPSRREVYSRLSLAYQDLDDYVHQDGGAHTDDELIWVYEHGPHLRGEERYETGISLCEDDQIIMLNPQRAKQTRFLAQVFPNGDRYTDQSYLDEALVIATSLEELHRQLKHKMATHRVQLFNKH